MEFLGFFYHGANMSVGVASPKALLTTTKAPQLTSGY